MGEMAEEASSPNQSDSEGSTSSVELGSHVGDLDLNSSNNGQICRWTSCGRWFAHLELLANHVTRVHAQAGRGGLFYCGWEGCTRGERGFNARYKMLVHVRTHTNEKPHHCFKCDKSFSRAENLKIHARSHTGERPYVCPVPGCGKAYSNSSDRFKHTRTHSVDKPYMCKVPGCPKRYTDPSSLRKHVKTYRHFPGTVIETTKSTLVEPPPATVQRTFICQEAPLPPPPPPTPTYQTHRPAPVAVISPPITFVEPLPVPPSVPTFNWMRPIFELTMWNNPCSIEEQDGPLDLTIERKEKPAACV